jgi:hypothetical protein
MIQMRGVKVDDLLRGFTVRKYEAVQKDEPFSDTLLENSE